MSLTISNYRDLLSIYDEWNHVYIFGAGKLGTGENYELLKTTGFVIEGYFDNHILMGTEIKDGLIVQDIRSLNTNRRDFFVFICASSNNIDEIEEQMKKIEITNYAVFGKIEFARVMESIDKADQSVKEKYGKLYYDRQYLLYYYKTRTGCDLNIDNPRSFNEKLQWLKLNDRKPQYTELVDKASFKQHIIRRFGAEYVIRSLGEWKRYEDIDFRLLPRNFVLKCTHDSGSIIVVQNKDMFDHEKAKKRLNQCLGINYYWLSREWPYRNASRNIIAEEYISDDGSELKDYKLFCFNGEVKLIQVDFDRFKDHKRNIYDTNWNYIPLAIEFPSSPKTVISEPKCLNDMISMASDLSRNIPHVRVDFYVVNEKPLVGEMTFYHGGGIERFMPEEWNDRIGGWIKI